MGNNKNGYINYNLKIVLPCEEYEYFVYRHIRLDTNQVFYIGYGKLNNGYPNRATKNFSRNTQWYDITNISNWYSEIIYQSNDIKEILEKEKEFIQIYGIADEGGVLCNRLNEGNKNYKISLKKRKEMSETFKKYWSSRKHPLKGIKKSKDHCLKMSENSFNKKSISCETNNKQYSSIKKCIIDIFGEFKKSHENGIRNSFKKGLEYKGYKFKYKYEQNAK